jgi:hypothetical protein
VQARNASTLVPSVGNEKNSAEALQENKNELR